jgi:hypothetical protein
MNTRKAGAAAALVLCLALCGCVGLHSGIRTKVDPYQGSETKSVAIMVAKDLSVTLLHVQKDTRSAYSLGVSYIGPDWILINGGESCILLADGERIPLRGDGSGAFREEHSGFFQETAWYVLIPRECLEKLANARQASLKVYGSRGTREGRFTEGARRAIRELLNQSEG